MLTEYVERAMSKAKYKKLDDGTYAGTIKPCPGVIIFGATLRECKRELHDALEGWIIVKLRHGDDLPIIDGINLNFGEKSRAKVDTMQTRRVHS
jgi:predicted RNase H-like HicB family nuclease